MLPCFASWERLATSSRQSEGNQPMRPLTWPSQKPPSPMLSTGWGVGTQNRNISAFPCCPHLPYPACSQHSMHSLSTIFSTLPRTRPEGTPRKGRGGSVCVVAHQDPLSLRFPRQECWSGLPFPPPGALLDPGIESALFSALQADSLQFSHQGSPTRGNGEIVTPS